MRRAYRRPYSIPADIKQRTTQGDSSKSLVQPAWDDTIHDLKAYRASPEDVLRRKLARTSRNQMGMALLSQSRSSAHSGQQQVRYSAETASDDSEADADPADGRTQSGTRHQQQHQHQHQHHGPQQQQQRHHHHVEPVAGSASVLAQYAPSTADSEDDVCQWQSPSKPVAQQQRQVLQDIHNSAQHGRSAYAGLRGKGRAAFRNLTQQLGTARQPRGVEGIAVDADMLQVLLDKISLLEQQLQQKEHTQPLGPQQDSSEQQLLTQLAQSQQQLAATQQQLHQLQDEHRQYVAHTSTLLTQLQTQVQQLMTNQHLPPQPGKHPQQQQQEQWPILRSSMDLLQPPPVGERSFTAAAAATTSSSTAGLQHISRFIRHQLNEAPAQQQEHTRAEALAAVGRSPAGSVSTSALSSPARKRADMLFTPPVVTDTVALPSYAARLQHSRAAGCNQQQQQQQSDPTASAVGTSRLGAGAASTAGQNAGLSSSFEAAARSSSSNTGPPRKLTAVPAAVPAAAAAAAVWEAELSSPRPQQLQVPGGEQAAHHHFYDRLSKASAELFHKAPAAPPQLVADLAALLRDLGLSSLELQHHADYGDDTMQRLELANSSSGAGGAGGGGGGADSWSAGATAICAAASKDVLAALPGSIGAIPSVLVPPGSQPTNNNRGSGGGGDFLVGLQDVDRGLQEGLPRAAVSRVFTAAGRVSEQGAARDHPQPRVLTAQLRNNMCLQDHLRAAAGAQ